jgi:predicted ATPase
LGTTGSFEIERELLANFHSETEEPLKLLERDPGHAVVFSQAAERFDAVREFVSERDSLLSLATGPFAANRFAAGFQRELSEWEIHHAIQTQRDAMIRTPQIVRPESRLSPDGQNLVAYLHNLHETSHEFKGAVTTAMQAAFGPDFVELRFPPAAEQRIQLEIRWRSLKRARSASDLSDGTLRFLFLIAILANPQPPPLIAIDEPETGLHPSMLRIVAEYARQAAERTQVVLTTHSPAFLDSFGDDPPITTIVEFRGGETGLRNVDPDQLAYWLKQFTLGELFRSSELEAMP